MTKNKREKKIRQKGNKALFAPRLTPQNSTITASSVIHVKKAPTCNCWSNNCVKLHLSTLTFFSCNCGNLNTPITLRQERSDFVIDIPVLFFIAVILTLDYAGAIAHKFLIFLQKKFQKMFHIPHNFRNKNLKFRNIFRVLKKN